MFQITCSDYKRDKGHFDAIWWEENDQQRGLPWVAQKKFQYTKKDGGIGFRDLATFNDALLGGF